MLLKLLLAAVIVVLTNKTWAYFSFRRKASANGCELPAKYAHKDPIFGLDLFSAQLKARKAGNSQATERKRFSQYGRTYETNSWGSRMIMTMDEDNIRAILSTQFEKFGVEPLRLKTGEPFISRGVFSTDGPYWEHSRRFIRPIFTRTQITDLSSLEIHLQRFIERLPRDGSTVDLQGLLKMMFLDRSTEMIFGRSTDTLLKPTLDEDANDLLRTYSAALNRLGLRIVLGRLRIFKFDRTYNDLSRKVHAVVDGYIDEAIERRKQGLTDDSSRFIIVDELVATTDDREEIRNQLLNIFLPARDSIALGLSGVLFHLARNPQVWNKLRAEALKIDGPLTYNILQSLAYTRAVINESLRLISPASRNIRICLSPTTLPRGGGPDGGAPIFVDKGDQVNVNFGAMHYDPSIWGADASTFRPERWLDEKLGTWQYIPFSAGPRVCPGRQITLVETAYVLVRLAVLVEKLENRDAVIEFVEEAKLTVESRNGVKVGIKWADRP